MRKELKRGKEDKGKEKEEEEEEEEEEGEEEEEEDEEDEEEGWADKAMMSVYGIVSYLGGAVVGSEKGVSGRRG